jgi:tetratricopeptide (TPR) repeat protein
MRSFLAVVVALGCSIAHAELQPLPRIDTRAGKALRAAAPIVSDAEKALVSGEFDSALALTDRALAHKAKSAWAHYVRAEALARLGKLDDALPEYRLAERAFDDEDVWGRSVVLWGRANAFYQTGRCNEAKQAFNEYIALVKKDDARAAEAAQAHIDGCKALWVNPLPSPPPPASPSPSSPSPPAATPPPSPAPPSPPPAKTP